MKINHKISAVIILLVTALIGTLASVKFLEMFESDILYPNDTLTSTAKLSDYSPNLEGTQGDTDIYFFEGKEKGATVLLLGGTHPNEPAGFMVATLLLENIKVNKGRVILIPQACLSGFTCTDPMEGCPQSFTITTKSGDRKFRFGSRVSSPLSQWPDPLVYSQYPSGQKLSGFETRNLNRNYPGRKNGTFTEEVGYGIMQLIKEENVDIAFDLHEAAPEIPIINAIVYHEKSEMIALTAIMNLEFEGLNYSPELSPVNFHGLSHREWGDNTDVIPFLMETSNPIQGRLRGETNEELILKGWSEEYKIAQQTGKLRIEYNAEEGEVLNKRVARHVKGFVEIIKAYNELNPDNTVEFEPLPSYEEIKTKGLETYLK